MGTWARSRRIAAWAVAVLVIAAASTSAVVFSGRSAETSTTGADHAASSTTSSTTTSTTTTTTTEPPPPTTTEPPAPPPAATPVASVAPAPAPAPVPDPPAPPPPAPGPSGLAGALTAALNADRAANGVGPLAWHGQLTGFAQGWANWMAANQSFQHQNIGAVIGSTSFHTMGENIFLGPSTVGAGTIEGSFMNSAPHRANLLSSAYWAAGVGVAVSSDGRMWVCVDFGG